MSRKKPWDIILLIGLIAVMIVSLFIIAKFGMFSMPQVDDFDYGSMTKHVWDNTHSFIEVIKNACAEVKQTYFDWQGTYSAIFLMALQPGIFGTEYYYLSTPFLLATLLLGIYLFIGMVMKYIIHGNVIEWLVFSTVIGIACLHFVPFPVEAFFWFNGAVYYTFFFSLELVLFGLIILYWNSRGIMRVLSALLLCALCPFLAGGSYAVALLSTVFLFFLSIYVIIRKKRQPIVFLALILMTGFLLVSVLAPGNNNHTDMSRSGIKAILMAVLQAIEYAVLFISKWIQTPVLTLAAITAIFAWGMVDRIVFRFQYPLALFVASVLIIAIGFTPTFYTIEYVGPDRLIDMQYYLFVLLLCGNVYYLVGWIKKQVFKEINTGLFQISLFTRRLLPICLVGMFVLFCIPNSSKSLPRRAIAAMKDGTAQEYYTEVSEMLETCENAPPDSVLVFPKLSSRPELLCLFWSYRDGSDDLIANYYSLKSFSIK